MDIWFFFFIYYLFNYLYYWVGHRKIWFWIIAQYGGGGSVQCTPIASIYVTIISCCHFPDEFVLVFLKNQEFECYYSIPLSLPLCPFTVRAFLFRKWTKFILFYDGNVSLFEEWDMNMMLFFWSIRNMILSITILWYYFLHWN